LRKLALSIVALLVLLVAGLLILPSFWDWNAEKGRIAEEVRKLTGRDLQIVGDLSLQLLPSPAFSANEVSLANIEGGSEDAMVQLQELRVQVALFPLLQQQVLVETVTLVKPEVVLEVLPDGRRNWDFGAPANGAAAAAPEGAEPSAEGPGAVPAPTPAPVPPASQSAGSEDTIRVDSFVIEDGTFVYRDAVTGLEERVTGVNAELAAESLAGPFAADGRAVFQGIEGAFDLSLGRWRDEGATPFSIGLRLPKAAASATFAGAVSRHQDLQTVRGRLQGEGENLATLLSVLEIGGLEAAAQGFLGQPFAVQSEITAGPAEAEAAALKLDLGETNLEGEGKVILGETPEILARLSATRVDLDRLLQQAAEATPEGTGGRARDAAQTAAPSASAPSQDRAEGSGDDAGGQRLDLPTDIAAELELTVDTLVYREQFARDLTVAARLDGGSLAVETLSASLPGGSEVSLTGALTSALSDDAGPPRFQGRLEAASDNLRALLAWLDVDIDAIPADRLRKMALTSAVDLAPQQITLRDTDLRLDVSRITGGVALALRERPGLGVGLSIDKLNLDAYLPKQAPSEASPRPQEAAEGTAESQAAGAQPGSRTAPEAAAPAGLAVLDAFDANLDIRVGALTYQGLPLNGLRLDATLQQGGLVVREASLMDLAGSRASFAGSLANVARQPTFDGSLDVAVASLSRLAKALALPMEGQPPLESFTLSGAVNGTPELVRFDQRLAALGGSLRAAGKAELAAGAPLVDAAVEASHPDLTVLLREMLPGEKIPAGLGAADLKGRLAAAPQSVTVSALEGTVAGVDLSGDLALALGGERPRVTADLTTGALPLAALAAPAAASGGQGAASGGGNRSGTGAERPRNAPAPAGRWSSEPLELSALRAVDAEVALQSAAILLDDARLDNAQLEATLTDGLVDLRRFTATAFGGALSVTGKADARETAPGGLEVAAAVTAIEMDLKALLRDLADSDRVSGPLTVEASLNASGSSEAALVNSLNGSGKIDGTLTVAAKAEEQAGALILNILGQKVREVRGISDSTTLLFSAFAGAPSKVDGTFVVEDGVLTTTDTRVQGRNARALTAATVNLPSWTLDSQTDVFRDSDPETAYLTAKLRGDLDRPNISIGGEPFRRRDESSQSGGGAVPEDAPSAQQLEPEAAPQQQEPPKPEDILKEGLKNLLQGLGG